LLKSLDQEFRAKGLVILGISVDSDRPAFDRTVLKNGVTWPQVFDGLGEKGPLPKLFNAAGVPVSMLLGRDGRILGKDFKPGDLRKQIEMALEK
jgi:hypothetical protein